MAIGTIQGGMYYDINRDTYGMTAMDVYEREAHYRRQQEEQCRRMQNAAYYNPAQQQEKLVNAAPKPDPKDPLSFLSKADNKILLTGEAS